MQALSGRAMNRARISGPQRTVAVDRGLYLVHYATADDGTNPPTVRVFGTNGSVEILTHPDDDEGTMRLPGSSIAVRVASACDLVIEVAPSVPNGSTAAAISLEPLSTARRRQGGTDIPAAPAQGYATAVAAPALRILGHVSGIGDVVVASGDWIAGPMAPSRVEGIAIEWPNAPAGVNLRYAVQFLGPQGGSSPLTDLGGFAGTRRRALALCGVVLELSGPAATRYQLVAEALFLGAPVQSQRGQRVVLAGATGREPLVGVRIALEEAAPLRPAAPPPAAVSAPLAPARQPVPAAQPAQTPRAAAPEETVPAVRRTGRVRVFRNIGGRGSDG
jgi:hypothetical protein